MTVPKAAQLSVFMSVPSIEEENYCLLPAFLSFTFLPYNTKHQTYFKFRDLHIAAACASWDSRNKSRVILDFSRNLGNFFGKYTGQVVKLDERLKKKSNFTFKVPGNHFHSNLK